MASIDRADWHYGGDFPEGLPEENGGTHIGMYLSWIILNDLTGEILLQEAAEGIQEVKSRKITGRDFLFDHCDEKFRDDCLNTEGLAFTRHYYKDTKGNYGKYLGDYQKNLGRNADSIYEIQNSWENYDILALSISKQFEKWKSGNIKKSWQFWKK